MNRKDREKLQYLLHDLRNFVGCAANSVQLKSIRNDRDSQGMYDEVIFESCRRAIDLTTEVSSFLQTYGKEIPIIDESNFSLVDIKHLYLEIVKPSYERTRKLFPIELNATFTTLDSVRFGYLDLRSLERLRENIINNAVNAGATKMDIHYDMKDSYGVVTFSDNGCGMSQEQLDMLVMKMYGMDGIHGIGTQSVFRTVEQHGFAVVFSSEIGVGTTVRVLCPYADPTKVSKLANLIGKDSANNPT
jgi:signal transduction histidine kinase